MRKLPTNPTTGKSTEIVTRPTALPPAEIRRQATTIDQYFKSIDAHCDKMGRDPEMRELEDVYGADCIFLAVSDNTFSEQTKAKLRALWEPLLVPATNDEIAVYVAKLVAAFLNAKPDEMFAEALAEDISAFQPNRYELEIACQQVRHTKEFLSIKAFIDALAQARRKVERRKYALRPIQVKEEKSFREEREERDRQASLARDSKDKAREK